MLPKLLQLNSQLDRGNTIGQSKGATKSTSQENKSILEVFLSKQNKINQ